jgi:hypothetical protein
MAQATHHGMAVGSMHSNRDLHAPEYALLPFIVARRIGISSSIGFTALCRSRVLRAPHRLRTTNLREGWFKQSPVI